MRNYARGGLDETSHTIDSNMQTIRQAEAALREAKIALALFELTTKEYQAQNKEKGDALFRAVQKARRELCDLESELYEANPFLYKTLRPTR